MTNSDAIAQRRGIAGTLQQGKTHRHFVPESRFGSWFISSRIWSEKVLKAALDDLERLIPERCDSYPTILDFGCGFGVSFRMLRERFRPTSIVAVDCDPRMLSAARQQAQQHGSSIKFVEVESAPLPIIDQSIDMIFCHQTLHHVIDQQEVLTEFYRVLKPSGLLLLAESTRTFITSWIIRMLFRHPMDSQRDAREYLNMIGDAGFTVPSASVSFPYLWWSRKDFGLGERILGWLPSYHEETLINLVAVRD